RTTGFSNHVFYPERSALTSAARQELTIRMTGLLESVPMYFDELPQEWLYLDANQSVRSTMTPERISSILRSVVEDGSGLWRSLL
ncbi:MAG: HipA family kinase, partial [bacterium]